MAYPPDLFSELLWQIGYAICHQLPERSFFIAGYQLPVCARDTGTMLGFGTVLLFFLVGKRWRRSNLPDLAVLIVALAGFALFALDAGSSYLGLRESTNQLRLLSGLLMGFAIGTMLLTVLSRFMGGDPTKRCFDWKDLLILLPLLTVAFLAIQAQMGLASYYLISTLTIVFLVLLFVTLFFVFGKTLFEKRPWWGTGEILALSVALSIGALVLLWALHRLTEGMVQQA